MTKLKARPPLEVKPGHTKGVLFGASGVGKTWFALSFPAPYYIDTEGGADLSHYMRRLKDSGGGYLGPEDGACDFDTILEQIQALATEKHGYKTLVIDSVTKVFQATIAKEAERLGDKDAFGASKKPAVGFMRRLTNWVNRIDMNVWFVAHETAEWSGSGNDRTMVGKTADVWDKLIYELDLTLRIERHSAKLRTATVMKSRLTGFPDADRFELQKDGVEVGYAAFAERYGKDFIEAEVQPIELATPEDVAEIERLLEVVKVAPADVEKALNKANADSFKELNRDQAVKMIDWLRKKVQA